VTGLFFTIFNLFTILGAVAKAPALQSDYEDVEFNASSAKNQQTAATLGADVYAVVQKDKPAVGASNDTYAVVDRKTKKPTPSQKSASIKAPETSKPAPKPNPKPKKSTKVIKQKASQNGIEFHCY
jgi:hypothetical protein